VSIYPTRKKIEVYDELFFTAPPAQKQHALSVSVCEYAAAWHRPNPLQVQLVLKLGITIFIVDNFSSEY
jgi:hypothetical protein